MEINPAKRTREEYEREHEDTRAAPGSGFDDSFSTKRQHVDPTTELINNVCKDIRRLGENPNISNQIDDIAYISNPIVAEFEKIDQLRSAILDTVYAVIIEQPHKIHALANLVLICNSKNFVVAKYVVEFLHGKVQGLLDSIGQEVEIKEGLDREGAGVFNDIKCVLKFFSSLAPIIEGYAITNVFTQLLQFAIELQEITPSKRHGIAQEIYYNVLISVPYLLSNDKSPEIIEKIDNIIELAQKFNIVETESVLLQPFDSRMGNYELPYIPKKLIDLILPSLTILQMSNWEDFKLFIDFSPFLGPIIDEALKNNPISNDIVKHSLPQFSLPSIDIISKYSPHENSIDKLWKYNSRILFQVYNNSTEFETVPTIDTYLGLFFKDIAFDILTNLSFNKNEAAIQLSILDLFYAKDLFTAPGTSIDQLTEINKANQAGENIPALSTWKIEDVAVESILTMIFQLPTPLHPEIYYYTVLIACCRESPESIAPVFGRAIRFFYNHLETLDYELKLRFLDWMTTQISNFEYSWKWDEWVADSERLSGLKYHPRRNFIKNLIAKEIRLSNKSRIKDSFVTMVPSGGPASTTTGVGSDDEEEEETEGVDTNAADGGTTTIVHLSEFNQYLDISMMAPNSDQYILDYDVELYGTEEVKETLEKLYEQKREQIKGKSLITAQDEIMYNFPNPDLPYHESATKVYEFVVSHHKTNDEFSALCQEILASLESHSNPKKFLINLIFQTYAYIGSRSIYSVVSILSRDIEKLKHLSGAAKFDTDETITDSPKSASEEENTLPQQWIIDAIFRIWVHQPQVVFLILEYLIEFGIVDAKHIVTKALESNLIIDNVSCMESVNRILSTANKDLIVVLFEQIVANLNKIQVEEKIGEGENDSQWLFFEYLGLLKSYLRKYIKNNTKVDYFDELKELFGAVENVKAKDEILEWIVECDV
ncbi:Nuclear cap-binding protein complex subunit 1 [Spathaspora sp. JA1]|nr:Nuclear cap-binding protein complex subunit 1 [Spathaspora sp. JA1]